MYKTLNSEAGRRQQETPIDSNASRGSTSEHPTHPEHHVRGAQRITLEEKALVEGLISAGNSLAVSIVANPEAFWDMDE